VSIKHVDDCCICEILKQLLTGNYIINLIKNNYEKALKEYVDCLHFILSIGNDINTNIKDYEETHKSYLNHIAILMDYSCIMIDINKLICIIGPLDIGNNINYWIKFKQFFKLGEKLGFTWEQIVQAYKEKNQVNHKRLDQGY